jgi:hypothetical protein
MPNGKTVLKRRQVAAIDKIRIFSVLYWGWDGKDRMKKQEGMPV